MRSAARRLFIALALAGLACDPGGGGGSGGGVASNVPTALVALSPGVAAVSMGSTLTLDVQFVIFDESPQAVEITVRVDPAILQPSAAFVHPDFDDDGSLFMSADVDVSTGVISQIIDVRHSPTPTGETLGVATVEFVAIAAGISTVTIDAISASTANGTGFEIDVFDATIAVLP